MQLADFRVRNYRSVNDSGTIEVRRRTSLVGRNESGKSNILLALRSLKPAEGVRTLSKIKDFPKDRRMSEYSDDLPVVDSRWELSVEEEGELTRRYPRARSVRSVRVRRGYGTERKVEFDDLSDLPFHADRVPRTIAGLAEIRSRLGADRASLAAELGRLLDAATPSASIEIDPLDWAEGTRAGVAAFRKKVASADLDESLAALIEDLSGQALVVVNDREQSAEARAWILEKMPVFIYLPDFPELEGHMDLDALMERMEADRLKTSDVNFLKLMKVAGLDVPELVRLLPKNHEMRQHLVNRGGAVVTKTLRRLWSDRALKVRFNLDANHFDTLVSDPNSSYDVEVNLDERSRGFRWFISFFVTFAADTEGGPAENAVLLLDEPGLHLHAVAQRDLLEHFTRDFRNQILFTTHSPFMIPAEDLGSVRTVEISEEKGTTVSNDGGTILDAATMERFAGLLSVLRARSAA